MALEGLRDSLKEKWNDLTAKVQESSAFNNAREKFEAQSPLVQKGLILTAIALVVLFVLSFPLGYLSDASDHMTGFEQNRTLIQGLLRASRSAKEPSPLPPPVDAVALRGMVERMLQEKKLMPEQMGEIQPLPNDGKNLAPPGVQQTTIGAHMKQLNLIQILDIANSFQNLSPGTKLIGFDIMPTAGQDHYYDLIAKVVAFGLPVINVSAEEPFNGKGKRPSKNAAPKADDEEAQ